MTLRHGNSPHIFLLTGHPRSGTTLITEILSRHQDIHIPPETHFFDHPAVQRAFRNNEGDLNARCRRLLTASPKLYETIRSAGEIEDCIDYIVKQSPWHQPELFLAVLTWLARAHGACTIGEKTPNHIRAAIKLAEINPGLRVIDIVRDPRDVAYSQRSVPWGDNNPSFWALRWRHVMRQASRARAYLGDRFLQLRYEDFVSDPEGKTRKLCDFLAVEFTPELLRSTAPLTYGTLKEPWKEQSSGPISKGRIGRWREDLDGNAVERMEAILGSSLSEMGYTPATTAFRGAKRTLRGAHGVVEGVYTAVLRRLTDKSLKE